LSPKLIAKVKPVFSSAIGSDSPAPNSCHWFNRCYQFIHEASEWL